MRVFADNFFGDVRLTTSDYPNGRKVENGRIQVTVDEKVVRCASYADDKEGVVRALEINIDSDSYPPCASFVVRSLKGKVQINTSSEGESTNFSGVPTYIRTP